MLLCSHYALAMCHLSCKIFSIANSDFYCYSVIVMIISMIYVKYGFMDKAASLFFLPLSVCFCPYLCVCVWLVVHSIGAAALPDVVIEIGIRIFRVTATRNKNICKENKIFGKMRITTEWILLKEKKKRIHLRRAEQRAKGSDKVCTYTAIYHPHRELQPHSCLHAHTTVHALHCNAYRYICELMAKHSTNETEWATPSHAT